MDRLTTELHRLYALPGQVLAAGQRELPADTGQGLRTLCLIFSRSSDWEAAYALFCGLQADLDLPPPAVSIDGAGFRFWFSLAEPVSRDDAQAFLACLQSRYLGELPPQRLRLAEQLELPPAQLGDDERWIAFIDPSMGAMFRDEAWLEFPPDNNRQADLLAGFKPLALKDFRRVLAAATPPASATTAAKSAVDAPCAAKTAAALSGPWHDPASFLLAVINDPSSELALRIEAAKSLLPYLPPHS